MDLSSPLITLCKGKFFPFVLIMVLNIDLDSF